MNEACSLNPIFAVVGVLFCEDCGFELAKLVYRVCWLALAAKAI